MKFFLHFLVTLNYYVSLLNVSIIFLFSCIVKTVALILSLVNLRIEFFLVYLIYLTKTLISFLLFPILNLLLFTSILFGKIVSRNIPTLLKLVIFSLEVSIAFLVFCVGSLLLDILSILSRKEILFVLSFLIKIILCSMLFLLLIFIKSTYE